MCPIILFPTNLWNLFQSVIAKEHCFLPDFTMLLTQFPQRITGMRNNRFLLSSPEDQQTNSFIAFNSCSFSSLFITLPGLLLQLGHFTDVSQNMPLAQSQPTLKFYSDPLSTI